ncbi:ATP-binding protein [Luminiphilus sp.]|nr:ATP-binding protein [Luminiphilus sp.]
MSVEGQNLEFKESMLWSQDLSKEEISNSSGEVKSFGRDASKIILAKVLASFLNSSGGSILIGVKELPDGTGGDLVGIGLDFGRLKDKNADGYRRLLIESVVRKYLPPFIFQHFSRYVRLSFPLIKGTTLCWLSVKPSPEPVFLTVKGEERFFIRVDAACHQLAGSAILDYCKQQF